jgi:hypothetical protein
LGQAAQFPVWWVGPYPAPHGPDSEKTASEEALKVSVATFSDAVHPSWAKILASIQSDSAEARVLLFPSRPARTETSDPGKVLISSLRLKIRSQKNPSVATRSNEGSSG